MPCTKWWRNIVIVAYETIIAYCHRFDRQPQRTTGQKRGVVVSCQTGLLLTSRRRELSATTIMTLYNRRTLLVSASMRTNHWGRRFQPVDRAIYVLATYTPTGQDDVLDVSGQGLVSNSNRMQPWWQAASGGHRHNWKTIVSGWGCSLGRLLFHGEVYSLCASGGPRRKVVLSLTAS